MYTKGIGYAVEMLLHPQTLYGIADSPAGLAAWIRTTTPRATWTSPAPSSTGARRQPDAGRGARQHHPDVADQHRGLLRSSLSRERLRLLRRQRRVHPGRGDRIPQGALSGSAELDERAYPNLIDFNEVDRGGHSAAWEEPHLPRQVRAASARFGSTTDVGHPHMPPLDGATEWLNRAARSRWARGHVVLVNFWTLTCITGCAPNRIVRAWTNAYRGDGLMVIGVHTPEFSFEHNIEMCGWRATSVRSNIRWRSTTGMRSGVRSTTTTGPRCTSSTPTVGSAITTLARAATQQSERAIQRLLGIEREPVAGGRGRSGGGG